MIAGVLLAAALELVPGTIGPAPLVALPGGCVAVADEGVSLVCRGAEGALGSRRLAEIPEAGSIAADGANAVLVGRHGGITRVAWDASGAVRVEPMLEDPRLGGRSLARGADVDLDGDGTRDLQALTFAGLASWRRAADGYVPLATLPVPTEVEAWEESVTLKAGVLLSERPGRGGAGGRFLWPESRPGGRLASRRVTEDASCTAWIATGEDFAVMGADHAFVLDGEPPRLAALLVPGGRPSLFGNARLLVAPLVCDETARGSAPELLVETSLEPFAAWAKVDALDVTADGTIDLVVYGHQGLGDGRVSVAVYAGTSGSRFDRKPQTWRGGDGRASVQFADVDADGRIDLVALGAGGVTIARGTAQGLFAHDEETVPLPAGFNGLGLTLADLDGDARAEAVIALREQSGEKGSRVAVKTGPQAHRAPEREGWRLGILRLAAFAAVPQRHSTR